MVEIASVRRRERKNRDARRQFAIVDIAALKYTTAKFLVRLRVRYVLHMYIVYHEENKSFDGFTDCLWRTEEERCRLNKGRG